MKKDVMEKWVTALRSGEYKQGTATLKEDSTYCCLGVLCEISPLGESNWERYDLPTREVMDWAGLQTGAGVLPKFYRAKKIRVDKLIDLNDLGLSFKQIANIIERNYREL